MNEYTHFGAKAFDPSRFEPIRNDNWVKPRGGLWASPMNAAYGWNAWCKDQQFREYAPDDNFTFTLKPGSYVLRLRHVDDLEHLPKTHLHRSPTSTAMLDFEELARIGVDAIDVDISHGGGLYMALYGWDCDTLLVLNPDAIEEGTDAKDD